MLKHFAGLTAVAALMLAMPAGADDLADFATLQPLQTTVRLNGSPVLLGTITATTTKNNHDTAVPFLDTANALKGAILLVQCDTAAYLLPGTVNTATAASTTGVKVAADEKYYIIMSATHGWLAAIAVAGTSVCKVWRLT